MGSTSTNPYTSQSSSGYNASPPADDGSEVASNKVTWAKIKSKLADVLKTFVELIDSKLVIAFAKMINTDDEVKNVLSGSLGFESDELTIVSGSVAPNRTHHTIDTQSDDASDDLTNATTANMAAEAFFIIHADNAGRTVVVKHEAGGAGEFHLAFDADYSLDTAEKYLVLQLHASDGDWYEITRSHITGVVQTVYTSTGEVSTGSTVIPGDDTIPQKTEGDEYMTLAITPKSATSKLIIDVSLVGATTNGAHEVLALFQDDTSDAIACMFLTMSVIDNAYNLHLSHQMTSGTTSETTFKVRAGGVVGTFTFNGFSGARKMGGKISSYIRITEVVS